MTFQALTTVGEDVDVGLLGVATHKTNINIFYAVSAVK
jgi:hypothetical protein